MQHPDLELVQLDRHESFKIWSHGYPYRTVRWHFHPEYEIHLITATRGIFLVGDHVGHFEPGQLVMTGPNLPHNWISDIGPGEEVPERCLVLQFTEAMVAGCVALFPELASVATLSKEARNGIAFAPDTAAEARPVMTALLTAHGPRRVTLFMSLLELLAGSEGRRQLASGVFCADPKGYMSGAMNHVLAHIQNNFAAPLQERELAKLSGLSVSGFSRAFRKHTGLNFVQYVNQLRVDCACKLLARNELSITEICYEAGFNNISNFNRQFLATKKVTPSRFRSLRAQTALFAASAA